jgi:hypothetical protein
VTVGLAVGGVTRADAVWHKGVDVQASQLVHGIAQEFGGRRIGQHDRTSLVHEQHRIRVSEEE